MIAKILLFLSFGLYGAISVYNLVETYKSHGFIIHDDKCSSVYYCNFVNCILGVLVSTYLIGFLCCKCMCHNITEIKMNFSFLKLLAFVSFLGVNIWNLIELQHNEECYLKYKIRNYSYTYIGIVGFIIVVLIINSLFCGKKKKSTHYNSMIDNEE